MSDGSPPHSPGRVSLTSNMMTTKQYIMVNLSKFIVEIVGTTVMGLFYLLIGRQQAGMLLGFWIITLFGVAISGAHFNPAVTVVFMLRKNSQFGSRRLLGILYIAAQFIGGILAATIAVFIINNANNNVAISPVLVDGGTFTQIVGAGNSTISVETTKFVYKSFSATISELVGTFMFVFLFMLCTDKKTQFSEDKVVNCFIMSSAYVAARLMAGGTLVTTLYPIDELKVNDYIISRGQGTYLGPLLNPALAFG
jgi:glycerol uptake facilitator-like aquaporin